MQWKWGFGLFRPSYYVLGVAIIANAWLVGTAIAEGIALDPLTIPAVVVGTGVPTSNLSLLGLVLIIRYQDYVSLRLLLLVFVTSIPASLCAMSAAQAPMLNTERQRLLYLDREFSLAVRQLLGKPLYRVLYLFHFGRLPVAARSSWTSTLCNLPALLIHLTAIAIIFGAFYDEFPMTCDALSACVVVFSVVAGITSLLVIETKARAIVRSGDLNDFEAQFDSDESQAHFDNGVPVSEKHIFMNAGVESC